MKVSFRFIKRYAPSPYEDHDEEYIMVQKKGWFGWKTLVEIYDGNWCWHYHWSYFMKPDRASIYDKFESKEKALLMLKDMYGRLKPTEVVV